jgi:hypothetical protein
MFLRPPPNPNLRPPPEATGRYGLTSLQVPRTTFELCTLAREA